MLTSGKKMKYSPFSTKILQLFLGKSNFRKFLSDSPGLVDFTPNLPEANEHFGGNFC